METFRLRADGVASSDLGSEIVLLDLETSRYFAVRDTGAVLLKRLVDGATVDQLVEGLLNAYEVAEETARRDVARFLDDLRSRNLLDA